MFIQDIKTLYCVTHSATNQCRKAARILGLLNTTVMQGCYTKWWTSKAFFRRNWGQPFDRIKGYKVHSLGHHSPCVGMSLFISQSLEAWGIQTSTCGSLAPLWWSHLKVYCCLAVLWTKNLAGQKRSGKWKKSMKYSWWFVSDGEYDDFSGSLFVGLPAWCLWCMQTRVSSSPALGPWTLTETLAQVFFFVLKRR